MKGCSKSATQGSLFCPDQLYNSKLYLPLRSFSRIANVLWRWLL